jgi:hypothetical protein
MREAGYAPKEERMIRLIAAAAAGNLIVAVGDRPAKNVLGHGAGNHGAGNHGAGNHGAGNTAAPSVLDGG